MIERAMPRVTTDQFVIYWGRGSTAPVEYLSESNLISLLDPPQDHVLTDLQVHVLSLALNEIHEAFRATYGPAIGSDDWYAMDVEFKFDDDYPHRQLVRARARRGLFFAKGPRGAGLAGEAHAFAP